MIKRRSQVFAAAVVAATLAAITLTGVSQGVARRIVGSESPHAQDARNLSRKLSGQLVTPAHSESAQEGDTTDPDPKHGAQFTIYRNDEGEVVCRAATAGEIRQRQIDAGFPALRQLNHLALANKAEHQTAASGSGLTIILRGTEQLQQNPAAVAAFTRAAQNWEALITSPVTIYLDVDYGTTYFGQAWPSGALGATSAPGGSYPYDSVRGNLAAQAAGEGNSAKQAVFNALPSTTVPTDLGGSVSTVVYDSNARSIGLLPATAASADAASRIGFNSNTSFDLDPSDGISAGQIDFDAVATHEIGHALGFHSEAGLNLPRPSVLDLYRFRTGATTGTFTSLERILTIGGSPDPLQFFFVPANAEWGLSTGGPGGSTSNGGDGWQSSHWKNVNACEGYIGIMAPAIPPGCRRTINSNDTLALSMFGYNLTNNSSPPPPPAPPLPPANDNFVNAQIIGGCSAIVTATDFAATRESAEPSHAPNDASSLSPNHTVWYQWQATSTISTTITTAGSDFDTILAVYTGSNLSSLTRLAFNDDAQAGVIVTSSVTFNATAGTVYSIAVDGWRGDRGGVRLNLFGCPCPSSLVVNDNGDTSDANPGDGTCATAGGVCTLRAAIQEANSRFFCGSPDINFSGVASPIVLNAALPNVNHDVNINGPGANQLTIMRSTAPGAANFRVFTINSGRTVKISGVTVANGRVTGFGADGGGILNSGTKITM
jgi:CSLREA domain-containing protein